jgi:hypothetical protein
VHEVDGIARPEGSGYAVDSLDAYEEDVLELPATGTTPGKRVRRPRGRDAGAVASAAPASTVAPAVRPVGTVKDGFTKLR